MLNSHHLSLVRWLAVTTAGSLLFFSGCSSTGSLSDAFNKAKKGDISHIDAIDPHLNLTRDDYQHLNAPKSNGEQAPKLEIEKGAPPVPKIADILAAPRPPKIGETQIVSIAVTDDVPLKDVLIELAKLADIDIELDAGITGGITFISKDRPFNEVIERIANLADLRYTMEGGVLKVVRDTPYIKSYSVDFLNVDRESDSSVNLSTNVLSGSGGGSSGGGGGSSGGSSGGSGGSGGLTTGSTSSVKTKSMGDFWKSLEAGVQQILTFQPAKNVSETVLQSEADTGKAATPQGAAASGAANAAAQAAAGGAAAANTSGAGGANAPKLAQYTLNRQAGVLTVNANGRQQELVERFLNELRKNASAQVLIEAKIIEVDLNDQYASGVNWSAFAQHVGMGTISTQFSIPTPTNPIAGVNPSTSFIQFASNSNPSDIVKLLEGFGTTRTLSSPRLHAINNQQSTMTFAVNHVYFTITVTAANTTTANGNSVNNPPTFNSTTNTVPIGIMMTMMPSIDLANNEVTLAVRPTLSTIIDFVNDPGFELQLANLVPSLAGTIHNTIPEIQVRELDSTLKLKSGQTMVIGGLMQQEATNVDNGVPFISGIPIIGNAFKNVSKSAHNKELVLLIKATIVDTRGSLNPTDRNLFHKFSDDARPVSF